MNIVDMSAAKKGEFALFIDESGSPKPNPKDNTPYFALGGVLVKRVEEEFIEKGETSIQYIEKPSLLLLHKGF